MMKNSLQSHWKNIFLLTGVAYFLLMFGNGIVSLTHPDEVFYVQTAKEMLAHKSWLTPYIFGAPQFEKPIFFYWLLAIVIKWLGVTPFAARFWPAFFGMTGVLVTYWISWMLFRDRKVAFWSGLILATSFIYVALSRAVLTDMVFSILVVITMAFFYAGFSRFIKREWAVLFYFVFMGFSVLTKGLLGICMPLTCALAFSLYKKDFYFFSSRMILPGIIIFSLIALPWHILMYQWYGQEFLSEYFKNVHINRLLIAEHPKNDLWYFYVGMMIVGVMPWTFLLFQALINSFKTWKANEEGKDQLIFLLSWILSVYIFVQPAHSKLASYIFPVFPALAIILGRYIGGCISGETVKPGFKWGILLLGIVLIVVVIVGNIIAPRYQSMIPDMKPVYAVTIALGLVALGIIVLFYRKNYKLMVRLVPGVTMAVILLLLLGRGAAEPWVSCEEVSERFKTIDRGQSVVLSSKFYVRGIRFYTDRSMAVIDINGKGFYSPHPIPFLNTEKRVIDFFKSQRITYGVLKEGDLESVQRLAAQEKFQFTNFGGKGGKYIVKVEAK